MIATSRPSEDHVAARTEAFAERGATWRTGPPNAGAIEAPPRDRKRISAPSGDHLGCVSIALVSFESVHVRPPPTGRT